MLDLYFGLTDLKVISIEQLLGMNIQMVLYFMIFLFIYIYTGRWGDSRSPAFGELTDYHLNLHVTKDLGERKSCWGEVLNNADDVHAVFVKYLNGQIKVSFCSVFLIHF